MRSFTSFNIIDRGDAFNDTLLESEHLIDSFNDNFSELFKIFAEEIKRVR